jgi:hypothetical protein
MTYRAYLFLHLDFATGQVSRVSILSEKSPTTEFGNGLMFHPTGFEAISASSWEEAQSTLLYFLKRSVQNGYWGLPPPPPMGGGDGAPVMGSDLGCYRGGPVQL